MHRVSPLLLLLAAVALGACGDDDAGTATAAGAGAEAGGFPVTLTHKFGRTTVDRAPRRVVTVGYTEQDTVLALGLVPDQTIAIGKALGRERALVAGVEARFEQAREEHPEFRGATAILA